MNNKKIDGILTTMLNENFNKYVCLSALMLKNVIFRISIIMHLNKINTYINNRYSQVHCYTLLN